jgi:hypothetical protein
MNAVTVVSATTVAKCALPIPTAKLKLIQQATRSR